MGYQEILESAVEPSDGNIDSLVDDEIYLDLKQAAEYLEMSPSGLNQMREHFRYIKNIMGASAFWPLSLVKLIESIYLPRIRADMKANEPKKVKVPRLRRQRVLKSSVKKISYDSKIATLDLERELAKQIGVAPRPWENNSEKPCQEVALLTDVRHRIVNLESARKLIVNRSVTDQLVSVTTATELMNEETATLWSWVDHRKLESVKICERKSRSYLVVLRTLADWLRSDYCRFRKYDYTELGKKLGQDLSLKMGREVAAINRITIKHWVERGLPKMATPGGQPMIPIAGISSA